MKKYIQSFRVFFGVCQIRSFVIMVAVIVGFTVLCGLTDFLPDTSFLNGFAKGVSSMMGAISAAFGIMFLNVLYQYVSPVTAGYKYYHSMPDSAVHFRRAIAASNFLGIATGLVLIAFISLVYLLIGVDTGIIFFSAALLFLATGVCNFTGFIRSNTARIISLMGVMVLFGFAAGFTDGLRDEDESNAIDLLSQNPGIALTIGGVSIAVFIAGLIYSMTRAEKKWGDAQ